MSRRTRQRKCRHCKTFFTPDPRNAHQQKYCSNPDCKKASKADSQRRWLSKPENKNYFSGPQQVQRVQQWRKAHPGYRRRKTSVQKNALQDVICENHEPKRMLNAHLTQHALQDLLNRQHSVLIGIISQLTGSALQDDIALTFGRMQQLGRDILRQPQSAKGGPHAKTNHLSAAHPQNPQTVQLGGSSAGP